MIDFQDFPEQAPLIHLLIIVVLLVVWSLYVTLVKKDSSATL